MPIISQQTNYITHIHPYIQQTISHHLHNLKHCIASAIPQYIGDHASPSGMPAFAAEKVYAQTNVLVQHSTCMWAKDVAYGVLRLRISHCAMCQVELITHVYMGLCKKTLPIRTQK